MTNYPGFLSQINYSKAATESFLHGALKIRRKNSSRLRNTSLIFESITGID